VKTFTSRKTLGASIEKESRRPRFAGTEAGDRGGGRLGAVLGGGGGGRALLCLGGGGGGGGRFGGGFAIFALFGLLGGGGGGLGRLVLGGRGRAMVDADAIAVDGVF